MQVQVGSVSRPDDDSEETRVGLRRNPTYEQQ